MTLFPVAAVVRHVRHHQRRRRWVIRRRPPSTAWTVREFSDVIARADFRARFFAAAISNPAVPDRL